MKKWLGRLAKLGFFLIAFFGVVITVLFNMGGDNDTLKGAIEEYIGTSTGYAAKIQHFNKMTFFPSITIDVEGVSMIKPDMKAMQAWADSEAKKPQDQQGRTPPPIAFGDPDGTIAKAIISVGFWDISFGGGRKIKNIQIQDAYFKAGTIHEKPLHIETLGIDETPEGKAFVNLKGELGDDAFAGNLDIESIGTRNSPKYKLGDESAFDFNIRDIAITGIMRPRTLGGIHIRDLKIVNKEQGIIDATFTFVRSADGNITMKGDFTAPEFGSNGTFDWKIIASEDMKITGEINAIALNQGDFTANSRISNTWKDWDSIFMKSGPPANNANAIKVKAESFTAKSKTQQDFEGIAVIKDNQITFQ